MLSAETSDSLPVVPLSLIRELWKRALTCSLLAYTGYLTWDNDAAAQPVREDIRCMILKADIEDDGRIPLESVFEKHSNSNFCQYAC